MGVARGTYIINDGLVFGYDTGYPINDTIQNSIHYKGEPTTNLRSDNCLVGMAGITLTYVGIEGEWKKYAMSGTFTGGGYPYCMYLCGISFTGGVTYSTQAIIKTNVENKFNYFGANGVSYVNQPMNKGGTAFASLLEDGSRLVGKYNFEYTSTTTQAGYLYTNPINNTTFNSSTDFVWIKNLQIEQKDHNTPYVNGSRSSTNSLIDLKKTSTINLSNVSFSSTGQPTFDGTNDYIDTTKTASQLGIYNSSYTMESVFKIPSTANDNMVFGTNQTSVGQGLHLGIRNGVVYQGHYGVDRNASSVSSNTWYHIVWKHTGSQSIMYVNGNAINSLASHGSFTGTTNIWIGRHWGYYTGDIAVAKIYNRDLTEAEIKQNYIAYKDRFGL